MGNNMTPYREESSKRIQYLIDTFCEGSQQIFADKCKIGKSSVSMYVKGTNAPTNLRALDIAKAFGVNPVWVMGFEADMYSSICSSSETGYSQNTLVHISNYERLDDEDKRYIDGLIAGMLRNEKYKKDSSEAV